MTDQTELTAQLAALQAQMAALRPAPALAPAASPWAMTAPMSAAPTINGAAIPIKLQTPAGSLRVYLSLPAECAATPQALMAAIEGLAALGLPLDTWQPKSDSGNGNGSSWGNRNNNRGGWK